MIGVDPAMTLVYRDEYKKYLKGKVEFKVKMIQEWLYEQLPNLPTVSTKYEGKINIFNHCTEKSLSPISVDQWQKSLNILV